MHQQQQQQQQGQYNTMAGEHTSLYLGSPRSNLFDTKAIRSQFVAKVYSILAVQLAASSLLIGALTLHQPTADYFKYHGAPYLYGFAGLGMAVYLVLVCVESARRSYPLNLVLLGLLTLSYGFVAAVMSCRFETVTVLSAFAATALACLLLLLLASYSALDVTGCGCGLCVLALLHLVLSLVLVVVLVPLGYGSTASLLVAGAGAFLASLYLLFDLQLIMGGRSAELSPEEYILAAALLYIDILQLFQYLLIVFGARQ